jgi:hypothetical protein
MRYGWTFSEVDEMDFELIDDAWNEGKAVSLKPSSIADLEYMSVNWRRYIKGATG